MLRRPPTRGIESLLALVGVLLLAGLFVAKNEDYLIGYLVVTVCAFLPALLWLRHGATGIPVFPIAAALFYLYYAFPLLRNAASQFYSWETRDAALTASSFLLAALIAWLPVVRMKARRGPGSKTTFVSESALSPLILLGLTIGFAYHFAAMSNWGGIFGTLLGVFRSIAMTGTMVACYLLGYARGRGLLRKEVMGVAITILLFIIVSLLASLYLVFAITYVAAAFLGYVITTRRVPWRLAAITFAVLFVLHAGKGEIRQKYWTHNSADYNAGISIGELPELLIDWVEMGIAAISSGALDHQQSLVDRASLLQLLARVQHLTPSQVPFLYGETYSYLPYLLVPRFLQKDKIVSQQAMITLNTHYGFQSKQQTKSTAIGWGLVSEGYANFGSWGVVGTGIVFGIIAGLIGVISAGTSPLSVYSLFGIIGMLTLMNPEADFTYMIINLWVATVGVIIFYIIFKILKGRKKLRTRHRAKRLSGPQNGRSRSIPPSALDPSAFG